MKILSSHQLRELDQYTIAHESIRSIDLMERAAEALTAAITERWDSSYQIVIFAGPGNNGGDALAVARLLTQKNYPVQLFLFNTTGRVSEECEINLNRLTPYSSVDFTEICPGTEFNPPVLSEKHLVIDGLFGSGLNKPLTGGFAAVVRYINASPAPVVSIDIPSGLLGEDNSGTHKNHIIKASLTLAIQLPKLSFFFPENEQFLGEWRLIDIGLSRAFIEEVKTPIQIIEKEEIQALLKPRNQFAHKGTFGHGLLIAGSYGMAGAAILGARACLRSGIGLLTVHTPIHNLNLIQTAVPEAIAHSDIHVHYFSEPVKLHSYQAVAIGPGIGQEGDTPLALYEQIMECTLPLVLDADAINILSNNKKWLNDLPKHTILTPHIKELERMIGETSNSYERLAKTKELAAQFKLYILIKGAWSTLVTPEGEIYLNPTGNPGMATAGSGDALTGILLALLSQGYSPEESCKIAVYTHGMAGDIAAIEKSQMGMTASDIVEALPLAWLELSN
ncbi:MAG: NAD(P)H-hydrate dehydratase [Phocaeicola sp.]